MEISATNGVYQAEQRSTYSVFLELV